MDAHYDQVMKARAAAAKNPPRLYFAYSTVLDREAFDTWKAQHGYDAFTLPAGEVAEALDLDLVYDFPSRWWGGRVAGLADVKGASVFGRLFEVPGPDWPIVQHKEGAITGMCVERAVTVRLGGTGGDAGGRTIEATAFTTNPARRSADGPVSAKFVEALVRGAGAAGLPAPWIERLRAQASQTTRT